MPTAIDDPPRPGDERWWFDALIARVVDGDTVDVWLDLGFRTWTQQRLRLRDIDAPEVYGRNASEEGRASKAALAELLPERSEVLASTTRQDKYGRWVTELRTPGGIVVTGWMVAKGFADPSEER